jgi:hypothetical protein
MKYKDFYRGLMENSLNGGVGDATAPSDVIPSELAMGVATEMEHTHDEKIATEIALDHLAQDSHYYTKLNNAGLAPEFKNVSPSGYGDPTSTFNQDDRLGNSVTCGPGNNIVGQIGATPDGSIDGKRDSQPIVNKTIDIEVSEPSFDDIKVANFEAKKSNKRVAPSHPDKWASAVSAAKTKSSSTSHANVLAVNEYKKAGGKWKI